MFGEIMNWKGWKDIKDWAEENEFKHLAKRLQLNNDAWLSSGEFGRSQVEICDAIRNAEDEEEALIIAEEFNQSFKENYGLY